MKPETEQRYRTATEAKFGPILDDEWKRMVERHEQKRRAHYAVDQAIRDGEMDRMPCMIHGCKEEDSDAHHPDYRFPLLVVWLCRKHHAREHAMLKKLSASAADARRIELLRYAASRPQLGWMIAVMEHMAGKPAAIPDEPPTDWGREEDFQDTIIEYDDQPQPHKCPHCRGTGIIP